MERVRATTLARIAIAAAGLDRVRPFGRGRPATLAALEHIGYAQIDTISVVGRAHAHVLQVRNPDFHPGELDRLLEARSIFEYWAHAAAYLPMRDFRFALPRMRRLAAGGTHWAGSDARTKQAVLRRIRDEGPLGARDFEAPVGHRNGWWSWKPAKAALERLFHEGALMVVSRSGFEKRFDLTERVLPAGTDTREPDAAEQAAHLVASARRALGVFRPAHVTHLRRDPALRARVAEQLDADLAEGRLRQVRILDDAGRAPWY
ncbi:MAG: crosslink repair DNA glycosylase YcaQ family protein, partial [Pseudomonadales bacterium]|nr:crosslink repair DNA glycosylase YcaQ family protein [Pseudomonadales bacterium]